jgi:soluble lytic murein transglycosylase-like protein
LLPIILRNALPPRAFSAQLGDRILLSPGGFHGSQSVRQGFTMRFVSTTRNTAIFVCAVLAFSITVLSARADAPRRELLEIVERYAADAQIPARLVRGVILVESDWNEHLTGAVGEIGLMQLRMQTARELGYRGTERELYNPETNIRWGIKYLAAAYKLAEGDLCQTSLKYQAGVEVSKMTGAARAYCSLLKSYMR